MKLLYTYYHYSHSSSGHGLDNKVMIGIFIALNIIWGVTALIRELIMRRKKLINLDHSLFWEVWKLLNWIMIVLWIMGVIICLGVFISLFL